MRSKPHRARSRPAHLRRAHLLGLTQEGLQGLSDYSDCKLSAPIDTLHTEQAGRDRLARPSCGSLLEGLSSCSGL